MTVLYVPPKRLEEVGIIHWCADGKYRASQGYVLWLSEPSLTETIESIEIHDTCVRVNVKGGAFTTPDDEIPVRIFVEAHDEPGPFGLHNLFD